MQRISVVGPSGAGKSTISAILSDRLGIEHIEIDAIRHNGGWDAVDGEEFRDVVRARCAADAWVADGNYERYVLDLVWDRADTVIVLEPPKRVVTWRVTTRTLHRAVTRQEMWGGLREQWRNVFKFWDPSACVIAWSWQSYGRKVQRYRAAVLKPENTHLDFVFLRSRRDVREFVDSLPVQQTTRG